MVTVVVMVFAVVVFTRISDDYVDDKDIENDVQNGGGGGGGGGDGD